MIGNSITIAPGGGENPGKVLTRVRDDGYGAEYYLRETDGSWRLLIRHSSSKGRERHYVEIQREVLATATTEAQFAKASFVLDSTPAFIMTAKDAVGLALTLLLGYSGTTDVVLRKVIGWDS